MNLCLIEKGKERKRLKEKIQILICVAKTKAELCYLLDFILALSDETVRERDANREKRKISTDRLQNRKTDNDITSAKILDH